MTLFWRCRIWTIFFTTSANITGILNSHIYGTALQFCITLRDDSSFLVFYAVLRRRIAERIDLRVSFWHFRAEIRDDSSDEENYNQCAASCDFAFIDCRQNCSDSQCSNKCVEEFLACDSSCPCGTNCPSGCIDCPQHPFCEEECQDPQLNNNEYQSCVSEAVSDLVCYSTFF